MSTRAVFFLVGLMCSFIGFAIAQEPNVVPTPVEPVTKEKALPRNDVTKSEAVKTSETDTGHTQDSDTNSVFQWPMIVGWALAAISVIIVVWQQLKLRRHAKERQLGVNEANWQSEQERVVLESETHQDLYTSALKEELGAVRMLGSPDIPNIPVKLLDTFVSLNISTTWRSELRFDPDYNCIRNPEEGRAFNPDEVMRLAFANDRMLLIVGDPGSGKTTLVNYYVMCCLERDHEKLGFDRAPLPMYVPIRDIQCSEDGSLCLPAALTRWSSRHGLSIPDGSFRDWLRQESTLILLDGLDEIGNLETRKRICAGIDELAAGLSKARFVITSRWTGYRKAEGVELGFKHIRADIKDFSLEQQAQFLQKWFNAAFMEEPAIVAGDLDESHTRKQNRAAQHAQQIIEFLAMDENKAVRELAAVPLLLQIIAVLWKEREVRFHVRSELFQAAIKYLLDFRDRRRGLVPLMPAESALRVLCPIALWMQRDLQTDEAPGIQVHQHMQEVINTLDSGIIADAFCRNLCDRAGLIGDYGRDHYIFRHKSFREYLSGLQLVREAERTPKLMKDIVTHLGDDWWEETLRFFIAEADDRLFDGFMDALFRSDTSKDLDPKSQKLLRMMIGDARQRRIDSLVKCLNDGRFGDNKKRYILDCLKTVGNEAALAAIREFQKTERGTDAARVAQEIAIESTVIKDGVVVQKTKHIITPQADLFTKLPSSFNNPCELGAEYLLIPKGSSVYKEGGEEKQVEDLYFARYPVTNKRYRRFIQYLAGGGSELWRVLPLKRFKEQFDRHLRRTRGFSDYLKKEAGELHHVLQSGYDEDRRFNDDDQPVVGVTWYAAVTYCFWLSQLDNAVRGEGDEGMVYRLPTEIEWQWAASRGKRTYPWGNEPPDEKWANYGGNVDATTPVGSYPKGATPEGLMDMAGNVWEWMANKHSEGQPYISLRGGSWFFYGVRLRCAARNRGSPVSWLSDVGFRVVRSQS